jgi:integrase
MLIRVKGLEQRDGVWKYRRMVPRRLRSVLPVYQVVRSLRTSDREAALRALPAVKAEVDRIFREAEAALANPAVRDYKATQEVQRAVRRALEADAEDRFRRPRVDSEPPSENNPGGVVGDEEIEALAITDALEKLENAKGEGAATQRAVLLALLKRLNGQPEEVSNDDDNPPLSIVFDRWREERQPPAKTWEEWATARRRFEAVVGADLPVRSITKGHVRAFKDALLKMPARRRGVAPDGQPAKLAPASIQKQLNALRSVLSWAVSHGYLETNPGTGISHARANGSHNDDTRRLPYDADDLSKLFASIEKRTGADRWLPLLELWTGARLEELGQLRAGDVGQDGGVPFIYIHGGDGRRVKNRGSERRVPLHPQLLRLGFLNFVQAQREAGHARLFPELKPDRHGKLTRLWGKRYRYFARSVGVTDPRKTFHSFRHGFKDAARAVMPEEHHDAITGHSNGSVGRSYGRGVPLRVLAESMAKVRFAGLG